MRSRSTPFSSPTSLVSLRLCPSLMLPSRFQSRYTSSLSFPKRTLPLSFLFSKFPRAPSRLLIRLRTRLERSWHPRTSFVALSFSQKIKVSTCRCPSSSRYRRKKISSDTCSKVSPSLRYALSILKFPHPFP